MYIHLGSYNKKLKVKQLSKHFLNLIQTEFPEGFLPYYMNPTDTSLNDEYTSTLYVTKRYLRRPMLSFDYNTNVDMINNVLNTPPVKGMKDKDVLTVITGLSGGKARVIEELKMKMNAEINNNTLAVSITYSLDWEMDGGELDALQLYPDAAKIEERRVSVGMIYTVIRRLARMLYHSRYAWLDSISIEELSKIPMADFHLVLIAFIQAVVDDMRRRGRRQIDNFVLLIDGGHKPHEVLWSSEVKIPFIWRVVVKALTGPDIERYTGIKTALVIAALPWLNATYAGEGQKCRSLVTPAFLDSTEIVEHIWLPQLQDTYRPLPPTSVARLELLAATCAQMKGAITTVGDCIFGKWMNEGDSLESVLSSEFMSRLIEDSDFRRHACKTPTNTEMHHLLYSRPISIDEDVEHYLLKSFFTNTIAGGILEGTSIVPDACVLVMAYATTLDERCGIHRECVCYRKPVVSIFDCCRDPSLAYGGERGLVQSIISNVFKVKMLVDLYCVDVPTTLAGLFGLQEDSSTSVGMNNITASVTSEAFATFARTYRLDSALPKKRCDPDPRYIWYNDDEEYEGHLKVGALPSYGDDWAGFYKALANTSHLPTDETPYVILLPSTTTASGGGGTGEASAYDLVIACFAGPDDPPHIAFISTSRASVPAATAEVEGPSESKSESVPEWHTSYHRTRTQLVDTALPISIAPTGLLEHIRADKWMHIHLSSDPQYTQPTVVADKCLVLGPAQVDSLMGPFREVYKAALRYVSNTS